MRAVTVSVAGPEQRSAVLALLRDSCASDADPTEVAEVLRAADRGEMSLDGLLCAERDGELAGALLYVLQPAETAFLWPPGVRSMPDAEAAAIADALLREAARRLDAAGIELAQCLLECDAVADRRVMERGGFPHLADLTYLQRPLAEPLPPRNRDLFTTVPFDPHANRERFAHVLERTYEGTLDCPGLNGVRSAREALDSHRHAAGFDPRLWNIFQAAGTDAGVMLLGDHPDQDAWEVLYMGVVPAARGLGYGEAIVLEGLHAARTAGRTAVLLAVDDRNTYAREIYRRLGFAELARRSAHVRFRPAAPSPGSFPHSIAEPRP